MTVLAFRHVPFEGLGLIGPALGERGITIEYADLYRDGASLPDISRAAGLIFLGGPMSVNDDLPYLRREMDFVTRAVARRQPVLGVCLGAQLIARALGAPVYRNPVKEVGWFDIHPTETAAADPLFAALNQTETVFHWHSETFDLPPDATLLAYSGACRNQAFRLGAAVYGMQFHLEITPEMIADWCTQDANCGDVRELDAPLDPHRHAPRLSALSRSVFGSWSRLL